MAELTHLNEASVVHNLHTRYQADLIYVRKNFRTGGAHFGLCANIIFHLDILWSILGDSKSVLPITDLHQRICEDV